MRKLVICITVPIIIPKMNVEGKVLSPKAREAPNITTPKEKILDINLLSLVLKNGFQRFFQIISLGGGASLN